MFDPTRVRTLAEVEANAEAIQDLHEKLATLYDALRDLIADGHVEDAMELAKANREAWADEDDEAIESTEAQIRLVADIRRAA